MKSCTTDQGPSQSETLYAEDDLSGFVMFLECQQTEFLELHYFGHLKEREMLEDQS